MTSAVVILGVFIVSLVGWFTSRHFRRRGISILIPFRFTGSRDKYGRLLGKERLNNMKWLRRYWEVQLPDAEIIMGDDPDYDRTFSKSVAVNDAARKAKGDIFVIVDADGFVSPKTILHCAKEIRKARKKGRKLWFVPYRQFYRLTEVASKLLLASDPADPFPFTEPVQSEYTLKDNDPKIGHWYGAMIQIMSREAFELVGGWDERFRGWGGEDHAAMRAMDTLYGLHKTCPGQVLHVWHPQLGPRGAATSVHWSERMWEKQAQIGANDRLSHKYYGAQGDPVRMRKLVDAGKDAAEHEECHKHECCERGCEHECHEHHKHHHHHRHHHHRPSV